MTTVEEFIAMQEDRERPPDDSEKAPPCDTPCDHCGTIIPGYVAEYCCSGAHCGCMGLPVEPPFCSKECEISFYAKIRKAWDENPQNPLRK